MHRKWYTPQSLQDYRIGDYLAATVEVLPIEDELSHQIKLMAKNHIWRTFLQ
jgi:hypothetical protein